MLHFLACYSFSGFFNYYKTFLIVSCRFLYTKFYSTYFNLTATRATGTSVKVRRY